MKKFLVGLVSFLAVACIAHVLITNAACSPAALGGTGTCAVPTAGQVLIGNGSSTYTPALLTPGTDIVIQTASGTITIAVNASAFLPSSTIYVATVNGQNGAVTITSSTLGVATNTISLFNGNNFTTTTIQAVFNALSATGLLTYNSSTGAFGYTSSSLALGSASQRSVSDFLASSTVYVTSVNGSSGPVTITSSTLGVIAPVSSGTIPTLVNVASYAGSDFGDKWNEAYASSTNGDELWVPAGGYTMTHNIVEGTANKNVLTVCSPGATITVTGTSSAVTVNSLGTHFFNYGFVGCKWLGPGRSGSSTLFKLGGSNGAEGVLIAENTISGFGKAFTFSDNVWNTDFDHDTVNNNGQNLYFPDGTVNSGENVEVNGGSWSNDYSPAVNPFQFKCIEDASNGFTSIYFIGVATDLCQGAITATSGLVNVYVIGGHGENPGNVTPAYDFWTVAAPAVATAKNNLTISDYTILQGASATSSIPSELITCNGICRLNNLTVEVGGKPVNNLAVGSGTVYVNGFDYNLWWNGSANVPAVSHLFNGSSLAVDSIENSTGRVYGIDSQGNITVAGLTATQSSTFNGITNNGNATTTNLTVSSTILFAETNASGTVKWTVSVDNLGFLEFNVTGTIPGTAAIPYNIPLFNCPGVTTTTFASPLSNFECTLSQAENFPDGSRVFVDHTLEAYAPFFGWGEFFTANGTSSSLYPYFVGFTDKSGNHFQPFSIAPVNSSTNSAGWNIALNNNGGETDLNGFLFQSGAFLQSGGPATLATTTVNGSLAANGIVSSTTGFATGNSLGISQSCSGIYFPQNSTVSGGLTTANSCFYSNYYSIAVNPNSLGQAPAQNFVTLWGFPVNIPVQFNRIVLDVNTADASTTDKYDIGIYDSTGNLLADIGATSYTSTGVKTASTTQGTVTLYPDHKYYVGITGNSTTLKFSAAQSTYVFAQSSTQSASNAGVLPATTTVPADSWINGSVPSIMLYR
jgi:hypothetical protein